ncbi:hypothetical protein N0V85_007666 [Neurospora sp. IMI 360204]|nr:hypothetical protein N0V85_007666 [Neurospora sp. IMI 360204]
MAASPFRPPYPEFHDELHDLPVKSVSLEALVEQKATGKGKRYTGVPVWGTPKRMTSERSKEPVIVTWIVDPTQDDRQEVDGPQISMTEEICREEADRLGLNCVIIRGAAHETRNIYVNGRTVTVWDASTGRFSNKQKEAESHFTVYMGRSNSELLLQGHIYVVWDPLKFGGLDRMTDPLNQRKHVSVEDGETPVALEYWSLTKNPLPLKCS